jgi:hypothetical protein
VANLLLVAGIAAFGWTGYQAVLSGTSLINVRSDLSAREASLKGEKEKYAALLDEKEKEGYDIRLYKGAFAAQEELNSYAIKPFKVLKDISTALGPVLSIDDIVIRHEDNTEIRFKGLNAMLAVQKGGYFDNSEDEEREPYGLYVRMSMTFSKNISPEEARKIIDDVVVSMRTQMPTYKVDIEKAVKDRSYEVDVEGRIGGKNSEPELQDDNTAVIEIRGAV